METASDAGSSRGSDDDDDDDVDGNVDDVVDVRWCDGTDHPSSRHPLN